MEEDKIFCLKVLNSVTTDKIATTIVKKTYGAFSFTASTQIKSEKRFIVVLIQNDNDVFEQIYKSETFDDTFDLIPSQLLCLKNNIILNTNQTNEDKHVKFSLYLSSNLTRGKDIVIGHFQCTLLDLLNIPTLGMSTILMNDYEYESRLFIVPISSFPHITTSPEMQLEAPKYSKNPLIQYYSFYSLLDNHTSRDPTSMVTDITPVVDVYEYCVEPRLSMKISLLFLENIINKLLDCHRSWILRRDIETMRLGKFQSLEMALLCGWKRIQITIISAKMMTHQQLSPRAASTNNKKASSSSTRPYSYYMPMYKHGLPYLSRPHTHTNTHTTTTTTTSHNHQHSSPSEANIPITSTSILGTESSYPQLSGSSGSSASGGYNNYGEHHSHTTHHHHHHHTTTTSSTTTTTTTPSTRLSTNISNEQTYCSTKSSLTSPIKSIVKSTSGVLNKFIEQSPMKSTKFHETTTNTGSGSGIHTTSTNPPTTTTAASSLSKVTDNLNSTSNITPTQSYNSVNATTSTTTTTTTTISPKSATSSANVTPKATAHSSTKFKKKVDERLPSTYIEVYIEDSEQAFLTYIGKTNVEWNTFHPVYGSQINSKSSHNTQDDINSNENTNIQYQSTTLSFQIFQSDDFFQNMGAGVWSPLDTVTLQGVIAIFQRYIPSTSTKLRLDMYDANYKIPLKIATASMSLEDILNKQTTIQLQDEMPLPVRPASLRSSPTTGITTSLPPKSTISPMSNINNISPSSSNNSNNSNNNGSSSIGAGADVSASARSFDFPISSTLKTSALQTTTTPMSSSSSTYAYTWIPTDICEQDPQYEIMAHTMNQQSSQMTHYTPNGSILSPIEYTFISIQVGVTIEDSLTNNGIKSNQNLSNNNNNNTSTTISIVTKSDNHLTISTPGQEPIKMNDDTNVLKNPTDISAGIGTGTGVDISDNIHITGGGGGEEMTMIDSSSKTVIPKLLFPTNTTTSTTAAAATAATSKSEIPPPTSLQLHTNSSVVTTVSTSQELKKRNNSNCQFPIPSSMAYIAVQPRYTYGVKANSIANTTNTTDPNIVTLASSTSPSPFSSSSYSSPYKQSMLEYSEVLASCYDWLWYLGFTDVDILSADLESAYQKENPDVHLCDIFLPPNHDKFYIQSMFTPTTTISSYGGIQQNDGEKDNSLILSRIDCSHTIEWLDTYIQSLEDLIKYVTKSLVEADTFIHTPADDTNTLSSAEGRFFRASPYKKDHFAQSLAKNLHIQNMIVRKHNDTHEYTIYDSITCGCMSPHALKSSTHGLKENQHGLLSLEESLQNQRIEINVLKQHYFDLLYPIPGQNDSLIGLMPNNSSIEWNTRQEILNHVCNYECDLVSIGKRKIFPMSQVLSIAINAVLSKLSLLIEGHISGDIGNIWLDHGILILYECLLSVIGSERIMIEDSASVIYNLQYYKIRLLQSSKLPSSFSKENTEKNVISTSNNVQNNNSPLYDEIVKKCENLNLTNEERCHIINQYIDTQLENNRNNTLYTAVNDAISNNSQSKHDDNNSRAFLNHNIVGERSMTDSSPSPRQLETSAGSDLSVYSVTTKNTDIMIKGREIWIFLPDSCIKKLPKSYQIQWKEKDSVLLNIVPVLFTQGIDLQQSVASSWTSDTLSLQYQLNIKGFIMLNKYCHNVLPCQQKSKSTTTSTTVSPRPNTESNDTVTSKNDAIYTSTRCTSFVNTVTSTKEINEHGTVTDILSNKDTMEITDFSNNNDTTTILPLSPRNSETYASLYPRYPYHSMKSPLPTSLHPPGPPPINKSSTATTRTNISADCNMTSIGISDTNELLDLLYQKTTDTLKVLFDHKEPVLPIHYLLTHLVDIIQSIHIKSKNVDMLHEIERIAISLHGCRVTFCKSGKDRTGMAVTLFQSRILSEHYSLENTENSIIHNANIMREYGTRLDIAEKNIGRRVYSINRLQVQFLPTMYRPPITVCESMLRKDNS